MSKTDGNKLKDSESLKTDVKEEIKEAINNKRKIQRNFDNINQDEIRRSSFNLLSSDNENDGGDKKINSYFFQNETPGFYEPSREKPKENDVDNQITANKKIHYPIEFKYVEKKILKNSSIIDPLADDKPKNKKDLTSTQDNTNNMPSIKEENNENLCTNTNHNEGETTDPNNFPESKKNSSQNNDEINDGRDNICFSIGNECYDNNITIKKFKQKKEINIKKLLSYDKPHNYSLNKEYKFKNLIERKKNFMNDIMYSNLPFSKLENIENFKKPKEYEKESLLKEVKIIIQKIINSNLSMKKEIITKIKANYISDEYTQTYLYNISPCFKLYSMGDFSEKIECFRKGKNDGDSFYKCFMFSLLEKYIINKKIFELSIILFEIFNQIDESIFHYPNIKIDKNEAIIILDIIITYIEDREIKSSIEFLNKSFCSNNNFCNTMVKYMKMKLASFIQENETLFQFDELISENIISNIFYENNIFKCTDYINEKILIMQSEPDLFIYLITPLALKVNLMLYVNESYGNKQLIHENIIFENEITIDLLYIKRSYSIFYTHDYFHDNLHLLFYFISDTDIFNTNNSGTINPGIKERNISNKIDDDSIKIISLMKKCKECGKEANEISLDKICPDFPICQSCLKINTDKVISNRLGNLIKNGFENIEFYTRSINLTLESDTNNLILSQPEFSFLYGNTETINSQMVNNSCLTCGIIFQNNNYIIMDCGCKYCYRCIENIIIHAEKKFMMTYEPSKCNCGKEIVIQKAIDKRFNEAETKKYKEEAYRRLSHFWKQYCLFCKKELKDEYCIIKIKNEPGEGKIKIEDQNHISCKKCAEIEAKQYNFNKNKDDYIYLECKLCNKSHLMKYENLKRVISKSQSKKSKTNCSCNIF